MKRKPFRYAAVLLATAFAVNSISVMLPNLISASTGNETPVIPLTPFSVSGMGGADVEIKKNNKTFIETDTAIISSASELKGIIAEIPADDNSSSSVVQVTPMMGGSALTYNSATVTHTFEKTTDLTDENGLKIATVSGGLYEVGDTTESQSYANIAFDKRNSFVGADGIMFYLKLDAANIIAPSFGAFIPETAGRWTFDFDPVLMLMVGKEYSYKTLNASSWTKALAVQDKEGSSYFGAMKFESAFEGYVKIPFESLGNDMGFTFNPNLDSLKTMCIKTVGLGGKYGTVTAGPYFVVDKDSTSGKIEVNQGSFTAAPASVGAKITGFKKALKETDAILVYVKTGSANRISVAANMWDDYLSDIPSLVLKSNATVYTVSLNADKWNELKTIKTEADGAIEFDNAFEGYIKIPISSLKEQEASPFIAIYPEIDYITGVEVTAAGIGGKFKEIETAPFLINEDNGTTSFVLSDEYEPPVVETTEIVPVLDATLNETNWEYVKHTVTKPLDYTNALGTVMQAVDENGLVSTDMGSSQAYANFKFNNLPLKGYEGIVFYVKFENANRVSPQISLNDPSDPSRWNNGWAPVLMLKVGSYYEYMPMSGGEWQSGTAVSGMPGNDYYGTIEFDSGFEGYIKIPYSSLFNDSGFIVSTDVDTVNSIVYRTEGLGGTYGEVTLGPTFFMSKDGSEGITLKKADPIVVNPVTGWLSDPLAPESEQNIIYPLDWSNTAALKLTAEYEYCNDYAAHSLAYARSKFESDFVLGDSTHIIIYIKTDSANVILPRIAYSGKSLNIGYDPEMTLGVGKTYSYLSVGGEKWISATTVPTWQSGSGDIDGDGVSDTYFGGLKFDGPFEGYVKFAVADLSNDYDLVNNADRSSTKIAAFTASVSKLGGQYGSVIIGPYFLTDKDTDSTELKLYEEPDPNEDVAVDAIPLNVTVKTDTIKYEKINPFRGLTLEGYTLSAVEAWSVDNEEVSGNQNVFSLNTDKDLKNSNGLLIYIKSDRKNVLFPKLILNGTSEFSLGISKEYMLLSFADAKWSEDVTVNTGSDENPNGGFEVDAGFEGYVRIPYTSFVNGNGEVIDPNTYTLKTVEFRFGNLGGSGNTVTLAPVSLITNEGKDTEIIYPVSYDSKDPYERIQGIFERSKIGLAQGNYFMVGDSTRHLYGYPIFRLVRNALKENYNINCIIQAQSGLKAEHWSNYTPGLDGPTQPTVDQLIEQMPGTGRNCIVDIALGINDSAKSGDEIYKFLIKGINAIKEAKPDAVIVYTSPSLISFSEQNDNMRAAAAKIWEDKSIYKIDVLNNVFADYYSQYYSDTHHPNSEGYRQIAHYIISCYVEGLTFDKIYDIDTTSYTLPANAKPITSTLSISNSYNMAAGIYSMKVNGVNSGAVKLRGSVECTGADPFDATNYVQTELSEPLSGNDYIAFYLKLPSANRVGVRAFKLTDNSEIIFKRNMNYQIMPLGSNKWIEKISGPGRFDGVETYGSLDFDSAFEGWVKLPLKGFYGSPSTTDRINGVTFRFSELGGEYGEVCVGAFFAISDEPYTAKNVWKWSDLPEMVPFSPITVLDGAPWIYRDYIASPIPSLTTNKALIIGTDPPANYISPEYIYSSHWASTAYDNMPLGDFTHFMIYVKCSADKENYLYLEFQTNQGVVQVMANTDYQLLALGETKYQYCVAERTYNSIGGIILPANFEGFIKIPFSSLAPADAVDSDTLLQKIFYRFSYVGYNDDMVIAGPVFGVTKDNDPGPEKVILTSLPAATTIKSLYAIEDGDIFTDCVMLYWEPFDGAVKYIAEAYSVRKTDTGFEYELVAQNRCIGTSGAITDLMPGRQYAIVLKAYDLRDKLLAIYDYTLVTTRETELYAFPVVSDEITYDTVYYEADGSDILNSGFIMSRTLLYIAIVSSVIVLLACLTTVTVIIFKRRKKNV